MLGPSRARKVSEQALKKSLVRPLVHTRGSVSV